MDDPFVIGVELTRHCNLRCRHCLRADTHQQEELPLELFTHILGQVRRVSRAYVALTGGEPTLHSRFVDVLEAVREAGLTCHMVTNGLTFPSMVRSLEPHRATLRRISFSLDGASEATHDRIRGEGSFRAVLLAIGLARYRGWPVTLQLAVNRLNRQELGQMPELAERLGVSRLFFCHSLPTPALLDAGLSLGPREWLAVEHEICALQRRGQGVVPRLSTGGFDLRSVAPCPALQHRSINIDYRGRLTLCCQLSGVAGEVAEDDLIADLRDVAFVDAYGELLQRTAAVVEARTRAAVGGPWGPLDDFQCWYCLKRFGKVQWMLGDRYRSNPWVQQEPAWREEDERQRSPAQCRGRRPGGVS